MNFYSIEKENSKTISCSKRMGCFKFAKRQRETNSNKFNRTYFNLGRLTLELVVRSTGGAVLRCS